jgi:anti-sigma factor RsiW
MSACAEYEPLLIERLAGELAPADAARLEAHLAGGAAGTACAACRAEAAAFGEALELVRLPPVTEPERRALVGLGGVLEREARAAARRRAWPARVAAVVAVAAASIAFLVAPAFTRRGPTVEAPPITVAWQAPDPDALLETAAAALGATEAGDAATATATAAAEEDLIQEASSGWTDLAGDSL